MTTSSTPSHPEASLQTPTGGLARLSAALAVMLTLAMFLLYGQPSGTASDGPVVFAATSAGP